jgi:hypothetical protein
MAKHSPPPALGCFGFLLLGAILSWPFYKIGIPGNTSLTMGFIGAAVVVVGLQFHHGWRNARDFGTCPRCSQAIRMDAQMCPFCHLPFSRNRVA